MPRSPERIPYERSGDKARLAESPTRQPTLNPTPPIMKGQRSKKRTKIESDTSSSDSESSGEWVQNLLSRRNGAPRVFVSKNIYISRVSESQLTGIAYQATLYKIIALLREGFCTQDEYYEYTPNNFTEKYFDMGFEWTWFVMVHAKRDDVIACVALSKDNEVLDLCTKRRYRGRGHARRLIEFLVQYVDQKRPSKRVLTADVLKSKTQVIAFWNKLGWVASGTESFIDDNRIDSDNEDEVPIKRQAKESIVFKLTLKEHSKSKSKSKSPSARKAARPTKRHRPAKRSRKLAADADLDDGECKDADTPSESAESSDDNEPIMTLVTRNADDDKPILRRSKRAKPRKRKAVSTDIITS